jgi:hypothetical protein
MPSPTFGLSSEPGLLEWLATVDKVFMTSRAIHGIDWADSLCRHFVIADVPADIRFDWEGATKAERRCCQS